MGNDVELTGAQTTDLLSVTGNASGERGTGVKLSGNNTLDNVSLAGKAIDGHGVDIPNDPVTNKGNTTTHPTAVRVAAPAFIGNNVVINGQLIERSDPRSNINSDQNSGHPPSSSRDITAQSNGQAWVIPFSLLRKRDQILSSLEGHHFPLSSQLTAYQRSSGQESVGNISFNICVPAQTTSETTGCDEHVLGKWIPLSSTRH
ncbi:hypothetical protein [Yersinia massiliensis]|uniref:hypothetical protein n=1 Tax=Yersinia massiliensis TaxID=419257 RepID=UPI001CFD9C52|nr:hypothetical protein [Yersinia massiliensis]MCB5307637.1 hypothetical protein [Yersinia massiliensis]